MDRFGCVRSLIAGCQLWPLEQFFFGGAKANSAQSRLIVSTKGLKSAALANDTAVSAWT